MKFFAFVFSFILFLLASTSVYAVSTTNMTTTSTIKKNDTVFILIHGSGVGSWIWGKVIPHLSAPAIAIDMPARTGKVNTHTFDEYTQVVVDAMKSVGNKKVILVGHSIGNEFALAAASKMPQKVAGIVSVGGLVPESGKSYYSLLPLPQRIVVMTVAFFNKNGLKPPDNMIIASYANDLDKATANEILKKYSYESPKIFSTPVVWDKLSSDIPRYYITFTKDKSGFSPSQQEAMAKRLHADKVFSLDTGHLGMLSNPKEFADILNGLVH